jgi:hypothetical protein
VEGSKIDLRQADAILKHRPDIIMFEMPRGKNDIGTIFNKFSCEKKPLKRVNEIIKKLELSAKKYPYALSDVAVWDNIKKLWTEGKDVKIYNIDSPDEIRREFHLFQDPGYPAVRKDPVFWAYLYLRDSHIAKNIKWVLDNYTDKNDPLVAVFLQSIHWKHATFLITNPTNGEIWKYYFGRFPKLTPGMLEELISKKSKVLARHWKKEMNQRCGIFEKTKRREENY